MFNNLGFPLLAMSFNWGRATLGTIPFATLGAKLAGVEGAMIGIIVGAALFGLSAVATAYYVTSRLAKRMKAHRFGTSPAAAHGSATT